jgi:hypothetical protein
MRVLKIFTSLAIFAFAFIYTGKASALTLEELIKETEKRFETLEAKMVNLQAENAALKKQVATLPAGLARPTGTDDLLALANYLTVYTGTLDGMAGPHIIFTGANVHVRSGSYATDDWGSLTGLGNLIVGYNEEPTSMGIGRGGSHNLVLGSKNQYSSYGGMVAGRDNKISGDYAVVSAGYWNKATGSGSSVSGGKSNTASRHTASVSGGEFNTASRDHSSVSGGETNTASGVISSVSGGYGNTASGLYSSVSGGTNSVASDYGSSVSGGLSNTASGRYSSVSGGSYRSAEGQDNWRAGSLFEDN